MMAETEQPAQFIGKLQKMMDNYKTIISWNESQNEIVIKDVKKMSEVVIPAYFRHAKYQSFVRQLNMYNFHKVCREKNNTINFKNDLFFKGNEHNYCKIKRKKKLQSKYEAENSQQQIKFIQTHPLLPLQFKEFIVNLINYKSKALAHSNKLKSFLNEIGNDLRTPKFRKFDKDISQVKSIIQNIYERSQGIDDLFNSCKQTATQFSVQPYNQIITEVMEGQLMKPTILGMCDSNGHLSMQRLPQGNSFPILKTKVNFIDVMGINQLQDGCQEQDRKSACSIQDELQQ